MSSSHHTSTTRKSQLADSLNDLPPESAPMLQLKQELAGLSFDDQMAAVKPPIPVMFGASPSADVVQKKSDPKAAALSDLVSTSKGSPLPSDVAGQASSGLGGSFSNVAVHTGSKAGSVVSNMGLEAVAFGNNVAFASGKYKPTEERGRAVLMHELAHVKQQEGNEPTAQGLEMGAPNDSAEREASMAAAAVLMGGVYNVSQTAAVARGFGATAKDPDAIAHENQTEQSAVAAGLTQEQADVMYAGNWHQDMNQMIMPASEMFTPVIYEILSIAHLKHFGFPIPSPEVFGSYDPIGHLDNPGGIVGSGIYKQASADGLPVDTDVAGMTSTGKTLSGAGEGFAQADPRYVRAYKDMLSSKPEVLNPDDLIAFQVDQSGIPVYLQASKTQLKDRMKQAAEAGGAVGDMKKGGGRGLMYAGEALHIMQDYYAHSNFCEIAINILLKSKVNARGEVVSGTDPAGTQSYMESIGINAGEFYLNSGVQAVDGDGNPKEGNLTFAGREVMATGTFTLEDTAHSIKEKVLAALVELNPFGGGGKGGPSEWTMATLNWLQSNPPFVPDADKYIGYMAGSLRTMLPVIKGVIKGARMMQKGLGVVEELAQRGMGKAAKAYHKVKGFFTNLFGGDSSGADAAAAEAEREAQQRAEAARRQREADAAMTADVSGKVEEAILAMENEGGLAALYKVAHSELSPLFAISTWVKLIPIIGPRLYEMVKAKEEQLKAWAREKLSTIWQYASVKIAEGVKMGVELGTDGDTRLGVSDPTTSMFMTQPTHTDVAKDFDPAEHAHGETISLGQIFGVEKQAAEVQAMLGIEGGDHDPHEHRHEGAWLAPIADSMARQSSQAIIEKLNICWEAGSNGLAGNISAMNATIDQWFAHPEDCKGKWLGTFTSAFQASVQQGDEHGLAAELARRSHLPPTAQTGHSAEVNKVEDHDDGHDHASHGH